MRGLQKPLLVGLSLLLLGTLAARPRTSVRGAGRTGVHYWTPVLDSGAAEHVSVATQRDDRPLTLGRRLQRRSLRHAPVDGGGAPSTGAACHLLRLRRLLRGLATRRGSLPPLRHREAVPGLVGGMVAGCASPVGVGPPHARAARPVSGQGLRRGRARQHRWLPGGWRDGLSADGGGPTPVQPLDRGRSTLPRSLHRPQER